MQPVVGTHLIFSLSFMTRYTHINKSIGCDNIGALKVSFGWKRPNPRWSCFDLVSQIRYHIKQSPIDWKWVNVLLSTSTSTNSIGSVDAVAVAGQSYSRTNNSNDKEKKKNGTSSEEADRAEI